MKTTYLHIRALFGVLVTVTSVVSHVMAGEIPIFNGTDLTGWEGNKDLWSVKDGTITGITPPDPAHPTRGNIKHNTFLVWKGGKVRDFELTFQFRIKAGNSGVQYRSNELAPGASGPIISGYQADIDAQNIFTGALYEERARGMLAMVSEKNTIKPGTDGKKVNVEKNGKAGGKAAVVSSLKKQEWNEYKIIAKGNHLQHFINGLHTIDVTDEDTANAPKEGVLALQLHGGPPMLVQFRNFKFVELN